MSHNYSKEQMQTNNQIAKDQLAMQQKQLAEYNDYVKQLMAGGGYLPGVRAAAINTLENGLGNTYNQIGQQLNTQAATRGLAGGGNLPGGGGYLRGYGNLLSAEAGQKAQGLNALTMQGQQNMQQGQQGILTGAGINTSAGNTALGSATSAANSATANQGGIVGSLVGGGLGILGNMLSPVKIGGGGTPSGGVSNTGIPGAPYG